MTTLDPIEDSPRIFLETVAATLRGKENPLRDIRVFKTYLDELIKRSKGLVIVDFLDMACWDCLHSVSIAENQGTVEMVWRDYSSRTNGEVDRAFFPADRYALFFHFQSALFIKIKGCPIPVIQGYSMTEKEIKKRLCAGFDESDVCPDKFFSSHVYRRKGKVWNSVRCLTTPIFSAAIIPKGHFMHALDSKVMLYGQNVWQAIGAISRVMNGVQNEIFGDEISEKGNTMRRVAEQLLKIECSFREIIPRKAYNQLLLKDLIALLKEHHNRIFNWGRIAQLTNHLSHDSGKPKIKEELIELIVLILDYANELRALVTSRPTPKKPSK